MKYVTGSHSTFEFPSRVPICTVSLGHWLKHSIGLAGATSLTWSDFIRLNLLLLKGEECVMLQSSRC